MKVKTLAAATSSFLEERINQEIKQLEREGKEIIDIKFTIREDYIYNFYAMIIYKDKNLAR